MWPELQYYQFLLIALTLKLNIILNISVCVLINNGKCQAVNVSCVVLYRNKLKICLFENCLKYLTFFFQFALILACVAIASGAPQYKPQSAIKIASARDDYKHATILRYDSDNIGVDGYKYLWVKYYFMEIDVVIIRMEHFISRMYFLILTPSIRQSQQLKSPNIYWVQNIILAFLSNLVISTVDDFVYNVPQIRTKYIGDWKFFGPHLEMALAGLISGLYIYYYISAAYITIFRLVALLLNI